MDTDVLIWWGHKAHEEVSDETVNRVQARVLHGMGLVVLHSGHHSKIFKRLMGTSCNLIWRVADELERIWVVAPSHPIAAGLDRYIELEREEMYGEFFDVPPPQELVFLSWFPGGEVFRSGCCYTRGPERSSTSAPATRAIRRSTTPMCGRSSAMPFAGPPRSTDRPGFRQPGAAVAALPPTDRIASGVDSLEPRHFDVIVLGGGTMGTAAAWALGKRGLQPWSSSSSTTSTTRAAMVAKRGSFAMPTRSLRSTFRSSAARIGSGRNWKPRPESRFWCDAAVSSSPRPALSMPVRREPVPMRTGSRMSGLRPMR